MKKIISLDIFSVKRLLVLLLCVSVILPFTSCGVFLYDWEVDTHSEFVANIEKYNSKHDEFVNTFISFDLDSNEDISKRLYRFIAPVTRKNIEIYDKNNKHFNVSLVFYMKSEANDGLYSECDYKIRCEYKSVQQNFSEKDKIEIIANEKHGCAYSYLDVYYEESLLSGYNRDEENRIYNSYYHYDILVNGEFFGCIHISSLNEVSKEKLNEITQMLNDSLVILNTEEETP